MDLQTELDQHVAALKACRLCPKMTPPPISGGAVVSRVMLVGQAPGVKEPKLQRPFAWTAGKKLFQWIEGASGVSEEQFRERVYISATCRCFPGKAAKGSGDRVPDKTEIATCRQWLEAEFRLLKPQLVVPVGKLAISQFWQFKKLTEVIGQTLTVSKFGHDFELVPLPHPSGASTWHMMEPGKTLTQDALRALAAHPVFLAEVVG